MANIRQMSIKSDEFILLTGRHLVLSEVRYRPSNGRYHLTYKTLRAIMSFVYLLWWWSNSCRTDRRWSFPITLLWRHNGRGSVSTHQTHDCLLNRLFRRRTKKTSKLRVTGLCAGNSTGTGEFPAQMASNADNVSIWWRHHDQNS